MYKTVPVSMHGTKDFAQFINKTPSPILKITFTHGCMCMHVCVTVHLYEGQQTTCENPFSYSVGPQKILSLLGRGQVAHLAELSCQPLLPLPAHALHI